MDHATNSQNPNPPQFMPVDGPVLQSLLGARVEASYGGAGVWFPGEVIAVHGDGSFDVRYDYQDFVEKNVKPANIRPESPNVAAGREAAERRKRMRAAKEERAAARVAAERAAAMRAEAHKDYNALTMNDYKHSALAVAASAAGKTMTITLHRPSQDARLGVMVVGRGRPMVGDLLEGGVAAKAGTLKVGDFILKINGVEPTSHSAAAEILKAAGNEIVMDILRPEVSSEVTDAPAPAVQTARSSILRKLGLLGKGV
eukprot:CAMPEP_0174696406 /NCGR_PEP_ID=MMETSP1094-20130205/2554_1 /TAXON_ID=156173 /ORGANISM="Chrysochromulina brevifilum, Strain UTEX LB 985" /LENGTH=256 /DNA_ID=CAMNT_0015893169 /DNA_START=63 /DNA_END=833 /DNA_ORIENTATION=+